MNRMLPLAAVFLLLVLSGPAVGQQAWTHAFLDTDVFRPAQKGMTALEDGSFLLYGHVWQSGSSTWLARVTPGARVLWIRKIVAYLDEMQVAQRSDGSLLVLGEKNTNRHVLYCLNADGNILWSKSPTVPRYRAMAVNPDGSFYLYGVHQGFTPSDPKHAALGRFSASGEEEASWVFDSDQDTWGDHIVRVADGLILSGRSIGGSPFVRKVDFQANELWTTDVAAENGAQEDIPHPPLVDADGDIVFAVDDFVNDDIHLTRLNAGGDILMQIPTPTSQPILQLFANPDGGYFGTGRTNQIFVLDDELDVIDSILVPGNDDYWVYDVFTLPGGGLFSHAISHSPLQDFHVTLVGVDIPEPEPQPVLYLGLDMGLEQTASSDGSWINCTMHLFNTTDTVQEVLGSTFTVEPGGALLPHHQDVPFTLQSGEHRVLNHYYQVGEGLEPGPYAYRFVITDPQGNELSRKSFAFDVID